MNSGLVTVRPELFAFGLSAGHFVTLIAAISTVCLGYALYRQAKLASLRERLGRAWGRRQDRDRDFQRIAILHKLAGEPPHGTATTVDDHTWQDLDLDEVFGLLDRTLTGPGEATLYRMLRTPTLQESALAERQRVIRAIQGDEGFRGRLLAELGRLGRGRDANPLFVLWGTLPAPTGWRYVYSLLSLLGALSLASLLVYGYAGLGFLAPMLMLNM